MTQQSPGSGLSLLHLVDNSVSTDITSLRTRPRRPLFLGIPVALLPAVLFGGNVPQDQSLGTSEFEQLVRAQFSKCWDHGTLAITF